MTIVSINLNSSFLARASYNVEDLELTVYFQDGRSYVHADVGFDVFDELEHSESAGIFYNDNIRNVYDYRECGCVHLAAGIVPVNTHQFQSSFLRTAQYNGNTGVCTVTMRNGRSYDYALDRASFNEFISAQSAGTYFNDFISRLAERVG